VVVGVVEEELPRGLYLVRSEDGRRFVASLPVRIRHGVVKLLCGERVRFEVSPVDTSRARIIGRVE
jgi:translation initiation factor IF-1